MNAIKRVRRSTEALYREPSKNPVIVLTTVGANFDARALARTLVEEHLAACINIVPGVTSIYRWQERVDEDGEQLLIIKTVDDNLQALREVSGSHAHAFANGHPTKKAIDPLNMNPAAATSAASSPQRSERTKTNAPKPAKKTSSPRRR